MNESASVALIKVHDYSQPSLRENVFRVLDAAGLPLGRGVQVLVKPNLLMANELACTNPLIVACACEWLLAKGARVTVADSPAFGTARAVGRSIGLDAALRPLGINVKSFDRVRRMRLSLPDNTSITLGIAAEALDSDFILSIPRIKAHSQMRITLAIKNCFGCICGARKAMAHARFGRDVDFFSDCVAALWAALPPVGAICDGIIAMNLTGPRYGKPFQLGLLAASASAAVLDKALLEILHIDPVQIPLARALQRRGITAEITKWPLCLPGDFDATGFKTPGHLKDISFNPVRLAKTVAKRIWLSLTD